MAHQLQQRQSSETLTDQMERPSLDDRQYKVIRLPNKLEALLIHDPDTDKASAALDVNAGSFSDEKDLPGMAHAVEHLLFMGTEKYPKENEYSQFLSSHSGRSNAFTASTSTNYFFEISSTLDSEKSSDQPNDVSESPLHGALDRFAQFFIAPLFLEETLDRELQAVDSENKKNLQNDTWRLYQLSKSLSNPDHPFNRFSTGNLKTLRDDPIARGVKIREEFMRFHTEQYSANRMKLVVLGREPLPVLQAWVEEMFAAVRNKDLPQNRWDGVPLMTDAQSYKQVFAKPVMDSRSLNILWPFLDEEKLYESQPGRYLSHLLGHEGPGSVLAYIKAKGWATSLTCGNYDVCPGAGSFTLSVNLTPDGLKNYKQIVYTVFHYLSILHETAPEEWIYNECKVIADVDFKFKQKSSASNTTSGLSQAMQQPLPRNWLLSGQSLLREFDANGIKKALSYLTVDNMRLTIVSQDELPGVVEKEHWYGTEYVVESIPKDFLAEIKKASSSSSTERPADLFLPAKNEFIPSRLDVERKTVKQPAKTPKLIRNDQNVRLWYKKDDQFWVPKGNVELNLRSPICSSTARSMVLVQLFVELLTDALTEYSYNAELAGLSYDVSATFRGLNVDVSGYSDKISVLLEKVLVTMKNFTIQDERFAMIKERLVRGYKNSEYSEPYHQIGAFSSFLATGEKFWLADQYLAELQELAADDLRLFHPVILQQFHIEALIHGNIYREDALKLATMVEKILKPTPLSVSQWPVLRSLVAPRGSNFVYSRPLKDPSNVNHCIEYLLQVGDVRDSGLYTKLLLFGQMTSEPAFDLLRTKEQLGYVVFSGAAVFVTNSVYHVLIQSERDCDYLEKRIDNFLVEFGKDLFEMTNDDFEAHKRSIINKRLEKLKNLNQECNRFWSHIHNEFYRFDAVDEDVASLKLITIADMVNFYAEYIDPSSSRRTKLSIHMVANPAPKDPATATPPAEQRESLTMMINEFVKSQDITNEPAKLTSRLESASMTSAGISDAIVQHLSSDLSIAKDRLESIIGMVKPALPAAMSKLGIPNLTSDETVVNEEAVTHGKQQPAVRIEDVRTWKASLALGAGASPVRDLSAYEDLEPKL